MSDNIIQLNEDLIKHDLKNLVRSSVEETLNALLDKEADELVNAQKYERSSERQGYRSGHYKRNFQTSAGEVELKVPKLKGVPFDVKIADNLWQALSSISLNDIQNINSLNVGKYNIYLIDDKQTEMNYIRRFKAVNGSCV